MTVKMNSENTINKKIRQKICEYELGTSMDKINSILEEGYEIADIVPTLQASGGMSTLSRTVFIRSAV